jgi:DNA binding domain, excisionase family
MSSSSAPDQLLFSIATVADMLGLGQTKVYRLVKEGKLRAVRLDGVIRIPRDSLEQYINSLPGVRPEERDDAEAVATLTTEG